MDFSINRIYTLFYLINKQTILISAKKWKMHVYYFDLNFKFLLENLTNQEFQAAKIKVNLFKSSKRTQIVDRVSVAIFFFKKKLY